MGYHETYSTIALREHTKPKPNELPDSDEFIDKVERNV